MVLEAVKSKGHAIKFASNDLQKDYEILESAIVS